eukprot:scaffold116799_cov46-Attheya_sp.AAC.1
MIRANHTRSTVFKTLVQVVREGPFPLPEGGFPPSGTFRRRLVPEVYVGNSNASGLNLSIRRINVRSSDSVGWTRSRRCTYGAIRISP